jgi:3-phenylpropionate/cinnamic acid dioxygenase small subunit
VTEQGQLIEGVRATLHRYARAVDEHDLDGLSKLVTEDVELRRVDGLHQGRDAFLDVYRNFFASPVDWSRHLITNLEIEVDPAAGSAGSHAYFEAAMTEGTTGRLVFGEYSHDLVRPAGRWLLRRKSIDVQRTLELVRS